MSEQPSTTPQENTTEAAPAAPAPEQAASTQAAPFGADHPAETPAQTPAQTPAPEQDKPAEAPAALVVPPVEADAPAPAPVEHPVAAVAAGDVVHFVVENPYHEGGARVETHAGLVVAAKDGRVRLVDLGDVAATADFPADAVQSATD